MPFHIIFIVLFIVLEALAAYGVGAPRWNLGWAGLVFFGLSLLV